MTQPSTATPGPSTPGPSTPGTVPVPDLAVTPGPFRRFLRRFRRQRLAMISLVVLALFALLAVLAPVLAPFTPSETNVPMQFTPPGGDYLLGTDDLGRDALSRLLYGTRISLVAPLIALAVAIGLGLPLGLLAGYVGGWIDWLVSRIADTFMSLPAIILAIALVAALGPSTVNAMIALGIVYAPRLMRVVRGAVLVVREETYIEASRSIGCSGFRTLGGHVLPNIVPPIVVQISLMFGFAVLAEASLSFLGVGVQPPGASWGVLLRRGFVNLYEAPWLIVPPGIAIMIVVLAVQLIGDGLRDSLGQEIRRQSCRVTFLGRRQVWRTLGRGARLRGPNPCWRSATSSWSSRRTRAICRWSVRSTSFCRRGGPSGWSGSPGRAKPSPRCRC
jgi:peptide/nickel transport system permease protein